MTEIDQSNRTDGKEMTKPAKIVNIVIQTILILLTAYIITRTVQSVGIVLFTWHPVLVSLGVS